MKKLFIAVLVLAAVWQFYNAEDSITLGPGVMAPEAPTQIMLEPMVIERTSDYTISELASFELTAKVLAKEDYRMDREADLSPTDLTLGWGRMSDESILQDIDISQSRRFYYWRTDAFPIPRREVETHSANMHLIPGSELVKDVISRVREGDIIELSGRLVEVTSETDDWSWRSSQTRNDTGRGACELIWVERVSIVTP
jgi:hypothetical protein